MKKRKNKIQINFHFSNRWLYTFITLGIILAIAVGVYAVAGVSHDAGEITGTLVTAQIADDAVTAAKIAAGAVGSSEITDDAITVAKIAANAVGTSEIADNVVSSADILDGTITTGDIAGNAVTSSDILEGTILNIDIASLAGIAASKIAAGTFGGTTGYIFPNSVTATSFVYSSDRSLKTNIQQLPNALEKLQQLNGVSFNWKSNGERSIGLIAQDVEKVYPEVVSTGSNGLKSVDYAKLVSVLIEAIKEQQKQIDELKSQLE